MVFENDWMVPFIISTATEISKNASCGSQRCLYLPSLAYALRSYLVRSGKEDLGSLIYIIRRDLPERMRSMQRQVH